MANERTRENRHGLKLFRTALIGAVITSVVQLLFILRTGGGVDIVAITLAAITGGIIGWGYSLATQLHSVAEEARKQSDEARNRLERTTNAVEFQQGPLKMLIDETHHPETVRNLLRGSLEERYRFISNVDQNEYLDYLMTALDESDKYEGIYCQPIRKYKSEADASESADDETRHETYSETYLDDLRDAQMGEKTRVFVIDPEDEDDMEEDLDNSAFDGLCP